MKQFGCILEGIVVQPGLRGDKAKRSCRVLGDPCRGSLDSGLHLLPKLQTGEFLTNAAFGDIQKKAKQ